MSSTRREKGWLKNGNPHGDPSSAPKVRREDATGNRIRTIIRALKARNLPHTTGFFFGASDSSQERMAADIAIFERALAWCEADEPGIFRSVTYRASW